MKAIVCLARLNPCLNGQGSELKVRIYTTSLSVCYYEFKMGEESLCNAFQMSEFSKLPAGHRDQASEEGEVAGGRRVLLEGHGRFLSCGHITRVERNI